MTDPLAQTRPFDFNGDLVRLSDGTVWYVPTANHLPAYRVSDHLWR